MPGSPELGLANLAPSCLRTWPTLGYTISADFESEQLSEMMGNLCADPQLRLAPYSTHKPTSRIMPASWGNPGKNNLLATPDAECALLAGQAFPSVTQPIPFVGPQDENWILKEQREVVSFQGDFAYLRQQNRKVAMGHLPAIPNRQRITSAILPGVGSYWFERCSTRASPVATFGQEPGLHHRRLNLGETVLPGWMCNRPCCRRCRVRVDQF
jgi:hypothetical protein